jgi:hypothetical protein
VLESFALRLSVECRTCRISIPLNGIIPTARCYHCGETNSFDAAFWSGALRSNYFAEIVALPLGESREATHLQSGFRFNFGHRFPRCERCQGPEIDLAQLASFALNGTACPACGTTIPVRRADPLCLAVHPTAQFLVGEQAPDLAGQQLQARTKPVVFQCMSCGGALQVDGSKRLVGCKFCNGDNYLPDGLWQMLNPVPKPEVFFLICTYESAEERAIRATHASSQEELASFASDRAAIVRRAVAANPRTHTEVLERLAFDKSREVLEGLAANPNLPELIVNQMSASDDAEFKFLALRHPRLSHDRLLALANDADPALRNAAQMRIQELRTQGVHVGGAQGFFSKLFGS